MFSGLHLSHCTMYKHLLLVPCEVRKRTERKEDGGKKEREVDGRGR